MSEDLPYTTEPNRIVSTGAETLDAIGLSFVVDPDKIRIEARTGPTTDRSITIDHDQIRAVEFVDGVAPEIEIGTRRTAYTVTGVTDSVRRARRIAERIKQLADLTDHSVSGANRTAGGQQRRARGDGAGQPSAPNPPQQSKPQTPTLNTGQSSSETESRAYPSDTLICPACGQKAEVPEQIPVNIVEVSCPGCQSRLGRVGDDGESVIIDPDV